MKYKLISLLSIFVAFSSFAQVSLSEADKMLSDENRYSECLSALEKTVPSVTDTKQQAEYYWRMALACVLIGEKQPDKASMQAVFGKGIGYADKAIAADPSNHLGYMWHCANVGRECQTHSLPEQVKALPKMNSDLETILNKLGRTDCFEAWQALAEIYYNHPFKSNDTAINYTRKSVDVLPGGVMPLYLYSFLAKMIYERGWNASKRQSDLAKKELKAKGSFKTNIDACEYYEGTLGASHVPVWSGGRTLGEMTDREEAEAIINYAIASYEASKVKSTANDRELKAIKEYLSKLKK